jgi:hypothetical protein
LIEGKLFKESGVYFERRLALTNLSCDNPCSADAIDSNKVNTEYKLKNALKNNPFNLCGSENRSIH